MPQTPKPRVLPRVTYAPPAEPPPQQPLEGQGGGQAGMNYQDLVALGLVKPAGWEQTEVGGNNLGVGGGAGMFQQPSARTTSAAPFPADYGVSPNDPFAGVSGGARLIPNTESNPSSAAPTTAPSPTGMDARKEDVADSQAWRMTNAVNNNITNTNNAKAADDAGEIARLQAEWERLTQSSIFKQMYGDADQQAIKARLINVYMNPQDRNAATNFEGGADQMIADDIWAEAFRMATGRAPNNVEWVDHNVGRDPLEGHPEAIQWMEQKAAELRQQNQIGQYNAYRQLLDKNNNIMS